MKIKHHIKKIIVLFILLIPTLSFAQFYFGRNKIQYEQFQWKILETDHFHIYYYEGAEKISRAAAHFAEESFDVLEKKFNYTMDRAIPLVIYSNHIHFQQTNVLPYLIPEGVGGFFEFIKRRVVIPYMGDIYRFKHVIRHELVHVFMHHKMGAVASDLGLWDTPGFPLWFVEGLAEFWSEGWDSQAESIIRDAVLHDYLYPLDSFDLMMAGFLLYKEGQSFIRFYEENYGSQSLRKLMEEYWKYDTFEKAISHISHKDFDELQEEWKLSLKKEYSKFLQKETILQPMEHQITETGINICPDIYITENGKKQMVYLTSRNGYTDIYYQALAKEKAQPMVHGERKAALESLHFLQSDINVSETGGLAFVTKSGARDAIKLIDMKNREEINSLQHPSLVTIKSPAWSPDGKRIIFTAQDFSGQIDLYLWDLEKDISVRLTKDVYNESSPCFDPSGNFIAFSSDRASVKPGGSSDIFAINLNNKEIYQLTNDPNNNTKPFWSKNHPENIYFLSDKNGTPNGWIINLPPDKVFSHKKIEIRQLTNFHTGIYDLNATDQDSFLVTKFQKYSYQIHYISAKPDLSKEPLKSSVNKFQRDSAWDIFKPSKTIEQKRKPYKLKYSLDFAQTAVIHDPIFGFLGGAQLGISDLLGNRYYHFLLANTAETSSEILDRFNYSVTAVDLSRRSNRALGFFHFVDDYYSSYEGFFYEKSTGIRAGLNFPVNVFNRLEFSGSLWHSSKDFYIGEKQDAFLLSNYVSYVHDNSIWAMTGPIDGWKLRMTAGPTFDFFNAKLHNYTILIDFRYYYRIFRNLTFAQRTMSYFNDGLDIRRFYIGGSWGLRGYRINEVFGRKYFLLNQELRFPFAKSLMLKIKSGEIGFIPIRGAFFFDVGNAWDYDYPGMLGSFGFGLRGAFMGSLVLRLDMGKKTDFHTLSKGLFFQFFFGWDY